MYRIHKRIGLGIATRRRPIDERTVGFIRVTHAAIRRRGNVTYRFRDHDHAIMRFAIMATGAIIGDARRSMVKGWHGEAAESRAMAHQAILSLGWQWHVCQRLTGRGRSIVTGYAGRR